MNTPRQSFSQVKDILKKLDQSIDAAREKRMRNEGPSQPARPGPDRATAGPSRDAGEKPVGAPDQPQRAQATPSSGTNPNNAFSRRVG